MRGKVLDRQIFPIKCRITPAYAGKSAVLASRFFRVWGSPPPMRGKVSAVLTHANGLRITPAYAGKRDSVRCSSGFRRDHPRLCGEKPEHGKICLLLMGSPPPMRGKAIFGALFEYKHRITPAYAGKRRPVTHGLHLSQDHPRLCGEKLKPRRRIETNQGSPPPMRGKAWVESPLHDDDRITPAYAGKSGAKNVGNRPSKDHPRLCGEKHEKHVLLLRI